jgi:protein-S-isoprenylcysteine O-methyltransferase Ste14
LIAAFWADRAITRPSWREEWLYRVLTLIGGYLLLAFRLGPLFPSPRLWALGSAVDWAMFALVIAGFAFAWWARLYLGRLWSSSVTRKADHRIVDTGPYAIVRHPIYTGLLLSAFATTLQVGAARAVVGALFFLLGFWIKARLEERFLSEQLGEAEYGAYRRRVPMLLPFGPRG